MKHSLASAKTKEERLQRLQMMKQDFFNAPLVERKYTVLQIIGEGASGVVCSALDNTTGQKVAIKRVSRGFDKIPVSVRVLRELKFLRLLNGHDNIVQIKDILLPSEKDTFNDVYVVCELMPTDLNCVLRSKTELSPLHVRFLIYQLLRGLAYIHNSGVFHRDLKPNNLLVNSKCELKICDLGLARAEFDDTPDLVYWTDYVATRWYRAPELIMTHVTRYSTAIDIWSVGCIYGEMLSKGRPLFPGKNGYHQLELITDFIGSPSQEAIGKVRSERAREHFKMLPKKEKKNFQEVFPDAEPEGLRLLERLLQFDPSKRPTANEALQDPYFKDFYDPEKDHVSSKITLEDFAFERRKNTVEDMRQFFFEEILLYHPEYMEAIREGREASYALESQATNFGNSMKALEEGVQQRKTTSMPKAKLTSSSQAYREKLKAKQAKAKASTIPEDTMMEDEPEDDADKGLAHSTSTMSISTPP